MVGLPLTTPVEVESGHVTSLLKKEKKMVVHLRRCSELLMQALQHNDCGSMEMESSSACCHQDNKDQSPCQPMRDV